MTTVISTSDRGAATTSGMPHRTSTGVRRAAMVAPPKAAESMPETVTPICTAERNRLGLPVSRSIARPRLPLPASWRTWDSRRVTSAISAAAKTPPMRMNRPMRAMSANTKRPVSGR